MNISEKKYYTSKTTKGFTLLELMVVIGIIGLVFLMSLPNIGKNTGIPKLDAAANALHSAASMARRHAITHQQPTYVVFQDDENANPPENAYRSYAVFTINVQNSEDVVDQTNGIFLTDWTLLPNGIVFDDIAGAHTNVFSKIELYIEETNTTDFGNDYHAIKFNDRGTLNKQTEAAYLCEGFYTKDGSMQRTSPQSRKVYISKTGHSRIQKLFYDNDGEPR